MQPIARCLGIEDGVPCVETATATEPVPLCTLHRLKVAADVLPELLRSAVGVTAVATLPDQSRYEKRLIDGAKPMSTNQFLIGAHAPRVYFVVNGNRIKIGVTTNLRERLSALSLRPDGVILLLDGGRELEKALHARFAEFRVGTSEWFRYTPPLRDFIDEKRFGRTSATAATPVAPQRLTEGNQRLLSQILAATGDQNGIHLGPMYEALGLSTQEEQERVRDALAGCGVLPRRTLRVGAIVGRTGYHRADIEHALEGLTQDGVPFHREAG